MVRVLRCARHLLFRSPRHVSWQSWQSIHLSVLSVLTTQTNRSQAQPGSQTYRCLEPCRSTHLNNRGMTLGTTSRHGITTPRAVAIMSQTDQHLPANLQMLGQLLPVVRVERAVRGMQPAPGRIIRQYHDVQDQLHWPTLAVQDLPDLGDVGGRGLVSRKYQPRKPGPISRGSFGSC